MNIACGQQDHPTTPETRRPGTADQTRQTNGQNDRSDRRISPKPLQVFQKLDSAISSLKMIDDPDNPPAREESREL